jgi:hypothetical protein
VTRPATANARAVNSMDSSLFVGLDNQSKNSFATSRLHQPT